jgi:malate permease and related proteins
VVESAAVTQRVVINLLLIAIGYLIKRVGLLEREHGQVLNRLVLYVTMPALNLQVISQAPLSWQLMILPVLSLTSGVLMSQVGRWVARGLRLSRRDTGTFVVSLCGVMGALAYPFVEAAYGDTGIRTAAISDLGNAVAIFAFAYYFSYQYADDGSFEPRAILKKVALFFPLHAFVAALIFNLVCVDICGLPGGLIDALASMNSPLMLLSLGVYLELNVSHEERKLLLNQLWVKYAVGFAVAILYVLLLPFRGETRGTLFLLPLMPTSLSTLLYSVEQGLNPRLAAMLISLTMVISVIITTVTILGFRQFF